MNTTRKNQNLDLLILASERLHPLLDRNEYLEDRRMHDALPGIILGQEGQTDRSRIVLERMMKLAKR